MAKIGLRKSDGKERAAINMSEYDRFIVIEPQ